MCSCVGWRCCSSGHRDSHRGSWRNIGPRARPHGTRTCRSRSAWRGRIQVDHLEYRQRRLQCSWCTHTDHPARPYERGLDRPRPHTPANYRTFVRLWNRSSLAGPLPSPLLCLRGALRGAKLRRGGLPRRPRADSGRRDGRGHQRVVSFREPSRSSRRYLGTAIRHRSRSPARGLVCQPSGSEPGGPASWTSATDTPCFLIREPRCRQDGRPLCTFQEATVSMAASSQTAASERSRAPVRYDDVPGIAAGRA